MFTKFHLHKVKISLLKLHAMKISDNMILTLLLHVVTAVIIIIHYVQNNAFNNTKIYHYCSPYKQNGTHIPQAQYQHNNNDTINHMVKYIFL